MILSEELMMWSPINQSTELLLCLFSERWKNGKPYTKDISGKFKSIEMGSIQSVGFGQAAGDQG